MAMGPKKHHLDDFLASLLTRRSPVKYQSADPLADYEQIALSWLWVLVIQQYEQ